MWERDLIVKKDGTPVVIWDSCQKNTHREIFNFEKVGLLLKKIHTGNFCF